VDANRLRHMEQRWFRKFAHYLESTFQEGYLWKAALFALGFLPLSFIGSISSIMPSNLFIGPLHQSKCSSARGLWNSPLVYQSYSLLLFAVHARQYFPCPWFRRHLWRRKSNITATQLKFPLLSLKKNVDFVMTVIFSFPKEPAAK